MSLSLSKDLAEFGHAMREWSVEYVRPFARDADTRHAPPENWPEILDSAPFAIGRTDKPERGPVPTFAEGAMVTKAVLYENLCYGDVWVAKYRESERGHRRGDATAAIGDDSRARERAGARESLSQLGDRPEDPQFRVK